MEFLTSGQRMMMVNILLLVLLLHGWSFNLCHALDGEDGKNMTMTTGTGQDQVGQDDNSDQNTMEMNNGPKSGSKDDMMMNMNMNSTGGHAKNFYIGLPGSPIIFGDWIINSAATMVVSFIGIMLVGILNQGLTLFREVVQKKTKEKYGEESACNKMLNGYHITQAILQMVQVVIGYFLMLIFMGMNIWLCIAVVLGSGLGYFFFAWKRITPMSPSTSSYSEKTKL